jgi:hypothetical protein
MLIEVAEKAVAGIAQMAAQPTVYAERTFPPVRTEAFDNGLIAFEVADQLAHPDHIRRYGEHDAAAMTANGPDQAHPGQGLHHLMQMILRDISQKSRELLHLQRLTLRLASKLHQCTQSKVG